MFVGKLHHLAVVAALAACGGSDERSLSISFQTRSLDTARLAVLRVSLHPPERSCADIKVNPRVPGVYNEIVPIDATKLMGTAQLDRLNEQPYRLTAIAGPAADMPIAFGCSESLVRAENGKLVEGSLTLTDWP